MQTDPNTGRLDYYKPPNVKSQTKREKKREKWRKREREREREREQIPAAMEASTIRMNPSV